MSGTIQRFEDVEFGDELDEYQPDVGFPNVQRFVDASYGAGTKSRFTDDETARSEGLPGAIVPGIMSQGIMVAMIHAWAPGCTIHKIDTVFRAMMQVGSQPTCRAVVTDLDDGAKRITLDVTMVNEAGETRVLGTATLSL